MNAGSPGARLREFASERRDPVARAGRDAVAAYFGIHPAHLSGLRSDVVAAMALRLEGRRGRPRGQRQPLRERGGNGARPTE